MAIVDFFGKNRKERNLDIFLFIYLLFLILLSIYLKYNDSGVEEFFDSFALGHYHYSYSYSADAAYILYLILGWEFFFLVFLLDIFLSLTSPLVKLLNRLFRIIINKDSRKGGVGNLSNSLILIEYSIPEGITSAEAGLLLHNSATVNEMFSLLYWWSSQKIIKINVESINDKEVITIKKLKSLRLSNVPLYEYNFFNNIFHDKTKIILNEYSELDKSYELSDLESFGIEKGRFCKNRIREFVLKFGLKFDFSLDDILPLIFVLFSTGPLLLIFLFLVLVTITSFYKLLLLLGFCFYFVIFILKVLSKNFLKLKRTEQGSELVHHILGFRKFLLSCDENKLVSILKEDPLYCDKILAYAVVFGIETDLMKKLIPVLDKDIDPGDGTYGSWKSIGFFKNKSGK